MACCLMAPSHHLNQCKLLFARFCGIHSRATLHSAQANILHNKFENYAFEYTAPFPNELITMKNITILD